MKTAASFLALASAGTLHQEFQKWKMTNLKSYSTEAEDSARFQVWRDNFDFVKEHNLRYLSGEETFTVEMNKFADMTEQEFANKINMAPMTAPPKSFCTPAPAEASQDNPASVDWRTKGYVTPIKNQEHCGSCWAFSTVGSLEGAHFKKTGKLVSLSEQNLVDCSKAEGNMGCHGGTMDKGFTYIHTNGGIDTEASYPYKGVDGTCDFNKDNVGATVSACYDVKHQDEGALETAVATIGPVSIAIDAHLRSFQLYKEGIYHDKMCSSVRLDHGVLAVGYSNATTKSGHNYWIVKNSWGEEWGDKGYIHMAKDKKNACGVATMATYPVE